MVALHCALCLVPVRGEDLITETSTADSSVTAEEEPKPFTDAYPPTMDNLSGRGLLNLLDPFPLSVLHLQLPVDTLRVMKEGDGRFEFNFRWANNYAVGDNFVVDAETYNLDLHGWYALRNDFYIGGSISVLARDSGVLDGFVDGFHDAFGLSDGGRGERPRDAYEISVTEDNGLTHELDRGVGFGDFVLKAHWNVHPGDRWMPAVALEPFLTLPTSTSGFGSTSPDLGLSVSFYKTLFERVHLYGVVGSTLFTSRRTAGIAYSQNVLQGTVGAELALFDSFSLVAQYMTYTGLLREPTPLNKSRKYVAAGFKWEFVKGYEFEFSVVENLAPFENSSDIAFALGFRFDL